MIEARIAREPIEVGAVVARVTGPDAGAVAIFLGRVRNENLGRTVLWLEYDAYPEMAEEEMRRIGEKVLGAHGALRISMVHRTGRLELGDTAVVVAVAAAHRGAAFDACREAMEAIKRSAPIWKKEVFEGGEEWIEGESGLSS
jgi:molybdopterin synthase catalytic subunit